ncbi:MAG: thermonuclease family protein [Pseudomonadota bacterium]|nr:thermonuclease family protein [Pseudomonadota bacterium]
MAKTKFKPKRRPPSFRPKRTDIRRALWLIPILLIGGALLDPSLIAPVGPLAAAPERVSTSFTPCGPGRGPACVVDGDTFKLGDRKVRITGIDAPELLAPNCPGEAVLARKSADRLRELLNQGEFEMVAHRFQRQDRHGRDLRVIRRNGQSFGATLIDEGLAHRYLGSKRSWC